MGRLEGPAWQPQRIGEHLQEQQRSVVLKSTEFKDHQSSIILSQHSTTWQRFKGYLQLARQLFQVIRPTPYCETIFWYLRHSSKCVKSKKSSATITGA